MPDRLEVLKSMLEQDPKNSFARYGLAMEYTKSGEFEKAAAEYETLVANDPDYAAAYFHGGQVYEKLARYEKAKDFYRKGIEITTRQGNAHAKSELQAALDLLP